MRFLLILLFSAGCYLPTFSQQFNIILGRPTDTSMTASILFDEAADYYFEFGTTPGNYPYRTPDFSNAANIPDEIDFHGLTANTRYFYRLNYRKKNGATYSYSPEYHFQTQRTAGSTFTFTIESDEHLYDKKGVDNMYRVTLANQAADQPDFMLSLGDIFGDDHTPKTSTYAQFDSLHKAYRPFLGSICHSIPFYICLGNHEGEKRYWLLQNPPNNIGVWGTISRKLYYPNPYPNGFYSGNTKIEGFGMDLPENYFAFNWGDALFVILDAYRFDNDSTPKPGGWEWTLGADQYNWLKNTLEGSKAKYKFVFAHHISGENRGGALVAPLNEWGGLDKLGGKNSFAAKRPGWAKPIHNLFIDNNVQIFFQGHDHLFAHEVLDGVTYQEVPMAADSTYQIGMLANADAYTSDTIDGTGHIRVTVSPQCVKVDYIKAYLPADTLNGKHKNGEIGFSYSIGNCGNLGVTKNPELSELVEIYPVPAADKLFFRFSDFRTLHQTSIYNSLGQLVINTQSNENDISGLPNGPYIAEIHMNGSVVTKKFIIAR